MNSDTDHHPDRIDADVLVIGGGPAGVAAATTAALGGLAVALVDGRDSAAAGPHRMEMWPPNVRTHLGRIGAWRHVAAALGPPCCPGVVSAWGSSALAGRDFITNPCGDGWSIDRGAVRAPLLMAAKAAGVQVFGAGGARADAVVRRFDGAWTFAWCGSRPRDRIGRIRARFLIAATGRSAPPAAGLFGPRVALDRLVAAVRLLHPRDPAAVPRDGRLLIEAAECGWWYVLPGPGECLAIGLVTDADLLPRGRRALEQFWRAALAAAPHTRALAGNAAEPDAAGPGGADGSIRIASANTCFRPALAGPHHLLVGDAAAARDPLSGFGAARALEFGAAAGQAGTAHLAGDTTALEAYAASVREEFTRYLRNRFAYYSAERRWPDRPFWLRRHAPPSEVTERLRGPGAWPRLGRFVEHHE